MAVKKTYNQVVDMLKKHNHNAPNNWEAINDQLAMNDKIEQLKTYKVKSDLWSGIEEALDENDESAKSELRFYKKYWFLILIIIAVFFKILTTMFTRNYANDFVYSSDIEILNHDLEKPIEDSENFELAKDFINQNEFMFSESILIEFNNELRAIEQSINEIKSMQSQYGLDESMIKLLSKMERDKATLIKSIINRT